MSAKDRLTTRQIKSRLDALRDLVSEACADAEVELHETEAAVEVVESDAGPLRAQVKTLNYRFDALDRVHEHLDKAAKALERTQIFDETPEEAENRSYEISFLDQIGWKQIRIDESGTLTAHAKGITISREPEADEPYLLTYGDIEVNCDECPPKPAQAKWIIDQVRSGKNQESFYWSKDGSDWQPAFLS